MTPEGERFWERIVSSLPEGLVGVDTGGRVTFMNPAAEEILNRSARMHVGEAVSLLFPVEGGLAEEIRRSLESGMTLHDRHLTVCRGGEKRVVSVTISPLATSDSRPDGVLLMIRDLTTVRELERSTRHEERLAMLGTVALGLAHEIRNPLGGIRGAAQLLLAERPSDTELAECLEVIIRESTRVDRLVTRLLDLGARRESRMGEVDVNRIIADQLILQRAVFSTEGITLVQSLDTSIPPFVGNGEQLSQLVLNLLKNAREALVGGGTVTVATRVVSDYVVSQDGGRRRMVAIEISDTGPGFPPGMEDRLGMPFFTTKPDGTGLGLALCQKIVSEHRGMMKFANRREGGGVVTVLLPLETSRQRGAYGA